MKYIVSIILALTLILPDNKSEVNNLKFKTKNDDNPINNNLTNNYKSKKIQVVFVLDVTGSMSGLIATAKEKIWSIANNFATAKPTPEIYMGIVAYRDRGDDFISKVIPMSADLDMVYEELMKFQAAGGGDSPESVNKGLFDAVNKMEWDKSKETYKTIFLVGDAPPHMDYEQDVSYEITCKNAVKKDITINTIRLGNLIAAKPHWMKIAELTKGEYFEVDASGGGIAITTPFDSEIAKLSAELDETRIYYGSMEVQKKQEDRVKRSKSITIESSESSVARRATYNMSGSGKSAYFGSNELLNDLDEGKIEFKKIKKDELPVNMQKMNEDEQKEYIEKMSKKRKELENQIAELSKKRNEYIKKQISEEASKNSFSGKVMNAVGSQAKSKGLKFSNEVMH